MEVIIGLALLGLFLFLALKRKSNSFNSDAETRIAHVIEQAALYSIELERRIELLSNAAADYDRVCAELQATRQIAQNTVPLELHHQELNKERFALGNAIRELAEVKEKLDTSNGKQISERVRLGQVSENIIPFLSSFPYDPKRVRGLFNPVDLLVFNDDEIIFVEVKTGDAKLTEKQRNIKRLIEEGRVRFEVHILNEKGHNVK